MSVIGVLIYQKSKLPNQTTDDVSTLKRVRAMLGGLLLLSPVVGLPWIFGIIVIFDDSQTTQYIYVMLNSLQGFFIWLSQCCFSTEARRAIKKTFSNRIRHTDFFDKTYSTAMSTRKYSNTVIDMSTLKPKWNTK
ncbi:adhesion G-protein coupled receptor F3-like [Antedon mediterranea]|uniref:adhesion G-protein coupled receptor F3-like n=1 Tax=Antedon mediterranea TaxID=105859 RepID=UPI003AF79C57